MPAAPKNLFPLPLSALKFIHESVNYVNPVVETTKEDFKVTKVNEQKDVNIQQR
jgi:hypothetical protein